MTTPPPPSEGQPPYGRPPFPPPYDPNQPYDPNRGYPPPPPPYGYGQPPYGYPPQPGWNGFAIAGFVLAFFCSILGVVFSAIALSQLNTRPQRGRGLAIAGLVISIASIVIAVIAFTVNS